jgi:hypothetical protein
LFFISSSFLPKKRKEKRFDESLTASLAPSTNITDTAISFGSTTTARGIIAFTPSEVYTEHIEKPIAKPLKASRSTLNTCPSVNIPINANALRNAI